MKRDLLPRLAPVLALLLALWGCADEIAAPARLSQEAAARSSALATQEEKVQKLARAIARRCRSQNSASGS